MPKAVAGPEIERLIQLLARLPGLGPRSARRAALFLIKKREPLMTPLAAALQTALDKIAVCRVCGNIDSQNPCTVCTDPRRDASVIVVVAVAVALRGVAPKSMTAGDSVSAGVMALASDCGSLGETRLKSPALSPVSMPLPLAPPGFRS